MHFSVSCPSCQTEFPVDSLKVPADGVHAICSTCERVFLVERPEEAEVAEPADAEEGLEPWGEAEPLAEEEEAGASVGLDESEAFAADFEEEPAEAVAEEEEMGEDMFAPEVSEAPEAEPSEEEPPVFEAPRFGHQDPAEKAARLARVLVQDMIAYNAQLHQTALARGTLKEDFENEVQKSWEEYVDRIGQEMATSTTYFKDALNDILAQGEQIFDGPP